MKLWLISQEDVDGWDTYDCAVVAAETELEAQQTHPNEQVAYNHTTAMFDAGRHNDGQWVTDPTRVTARYLGETNEPAGVVCASYHAG